MRKFTLVLVAVMIAVLASAQTPAQLGRECSQARTLPVPSGRLQPCNVSAVLTSGLGHADGAKAPVRKSAAKAETEDGAGLPEFDKTVTTAQPEGTLKTYMRTGGAYQYYNGWIYTAQQNGVPMDIVTEADGKTVWLQDIVSQAAAGTWVMGTLEDGKIHVPLYQCVAYDSQYGYGFFLAKADCEVTYNDDGTASGRYYPDFTATEMTYTVGDDGTISLDGTDEIIPDVNLPRTIMALIYDDNQAWSGYGDYQSCYREFTGEPVQQPEGLDMQECSFLYSDGKVTHAALLQMAIDGDKVYVKGLSDSDPESIVTGTISGDKATFASDQYLGRESGYLLYFCGADVSRETAWDDYSQEEYTKYTYTYIPQIVMDYDAEQRKFTASDDKAIILNCGPGAEQIYYYSVHIDPKLGNIEERATTPADPGMLLFTDEDYADYGYCFLMFDIKLEDTEGNYLLPEKLYYILWVLNDGKPEKFVCTAADYYAFASMGIDELVEIPYDFEAYDMFDLPDIAKGGEAMCIYHGGYEDYGVQSVYYGGGERRESAISWWGEGPSGIISATAGAASTEAAAFFSPDGKRLNGPRRGLNIVRMADGSVKKIIF